jgi:YD repeat-containing protein
MLDAQLSARFLACRRRGSPTPSAGQTTTCQLDEIRNVIAETDPLGHTVRREWGAFDRLVTRIDALGNIMRFHLRLGPESSDGPPISTV